MLLRRQPQPNCSILYLKRLTIIYSDSAWKIIPNSLQIRGINYLKSNHIVVTKKNNLNLQLRMKIRSKTKLSTKLPVTDEYNNMYNKYELKTYVIISQSSSSRFKNKGSTSSNLSFSRESILLLHKPSSSHLPASALRDRLDLSSKLLYITSMVIGNGLQDVFNVDQCYK